MGAQPHGNKKVSTQVIEERKAFEMRMLVTQVIDIKDLIKSLILAQDERWRRA